MNKISKKLLLVNSFGTLGYMTCLLLWLWVIVFYLPLLFGNEQVMNFLMPSAGEPQQTPEPGASSPAIAFIAFAISAMVIVATIYVLLKAPISIAKSGKAVTTKTASTLTPLVTRGRPLPVKNKRQLTAALIKVVKLLLVLIPVIGGILTRLTPLTLPYEIVLLVTGMLGIIAICWFSAQYIFAYMFGVEPEKLV